LSKKLGNNREKIENIRYAVDGDLKLLKDGRDVESKDISPQGITVEEITF